MNKEIEEKLSKYNNGVKDLFLKIRKIIYETNLQIDERIWASIPSFYYGISLFESYLLRITLI
jgi:hypothetical protein